MLDTLLQTYSSLLHFIAEFTVHSLELVGILIIIIGSVKAISITLSRLKAKKGANAILDLGRSLALAL